MSEEQDIKPNIASLKSMLDTENTSPSRNLSKLSGASRLPSFKAPRDLTLSSAAFKPSMLREKKRVMPNIPIKREKNVALM